MPFDVVFDDDPELVVCRVRGERLPESLTDDCLAVARRIVTRLRRQDRHRVLVISTVHGPISAEGMFAVRDRLRSLGWTRDIRCAIVALDGQSLIDHAGTPDIFREKGYTGRIFGSEGSAGP